MSRILYMIFKNATVKQKVFYSKDWAAVNSAQKQSVKNMNKLLKVKVWMFEKGIDQQPLF